MAGDGDYGCDFGDAKALTDEFGGYEASCSGDDELHRLKLFLLIRYRFSRSKGQKVRNRREDSLCIFWVSQIDGILVTSKYMRLDRSSLIAHLKSGTVH